MAHDAQHTPTVNAHEPPPDGEITLIATPAASHAARPMAAMAREEYAATEYGATNSSSCGTFRIDPSFRAMTITVTSPAITPHAEANGARRRHHSGPVITAAAATPAANKGGLRRSRPSSCTRTSSSH